MNSKLPYVLALCTVGSMFLLSQEAIAQDGGYPTHNFQEPSYQELNLNEDKSLIYDMGESKPSRATNVTLRDTVSAKTAKAKVSKKPVADNKEEDALSFNFLYYIIQKYKISDIVDQ